VGSAIHAAWSSAEFGPCPTMRSACSRERHASRTESDKSDDTPISGTRAARYHVVVRVDADTLAAGGERGQKQAQGWSDVSAERSDQALPVWEEVRM